MKTLSSSHFVVDFDPEIFSLFGQSIRWYGLMYVIGLLLSGPLLKILVKRGFFKVPEEKIENLIQTIIICMFIGARAAYVFIYNWDHYGQNLIEIFYFWNGGLSFHGALAGILFAGFLYAKKNNISWAQTMDVIALAGTPGLFFGRMGNFINGELYGRQSEMAWAMIFPKGGPFPRHPSQLYEGIAEGLLLSLILWFLSKRVKSYGILASCFLIFYGLFRYIIEFFREADIQLGYYLNGTTTMGQILCLIMIIGGGISLKICLSKKINH